jgi:D-alanyl-lipoteichoic acid acyltransferase DltB (MBOAT superfamily)
VLFNSIEFLIIFLPIVLGLFLWINASKYSLYGPSFLAIASLFFYGWWDIKYVPLILASVVINWRFRGTLIRNRNKYVLAIAIFINITALAYYKYANFFVNNLNEYTGTNFVLGMIILPLGISFFTFTQIAFLVDTYKGSVKEYNFIHYVLFVTFFPHLIAGPVLHHKEMMPQFSEMKGKYPTSTMVGHGLLLLVIGLFKKVIIADSLARYIDPSFANVATIEILDAWTATVGYTLQLYFDFSAYSEMAMGIALLFGIRLPINFNSPYKASDISDFWKRWHMTLSRFLKDYVYIPLGGNRNGFNKMLIAIGITMLLGGIWHGAGWQYFIWGGMHGLFIIIHRIWKKNGGMLSESAGRALTFFSVMFAWVMFRAASVSDALFIWKKMLGLEGVVLPLAYQNASAYGFKIAMSPTINGLEIVYMAMGIAFCMKASNVHEILNNTHLPTRKMGISVVLIALISIFALNTPTSFQYFQF